MSVYKKKYIHKKIYITKKCKYEKSPVIVGGYEAYCHLGLV